MTTFFSYFLPILSSMLFLNITLFYLDDFKISPYSKIIRTLQNLTPLWIVLFITGLCYLNVIIIDQDIIFNINDSKENTNTNHIQIGNIKIDREAADTIVRNTGYAGIVTGIGSAVSKAIATSSIPPVRKAGIIVCSSIAGAAIHIVGTNLNRSFSKTSNNKYDVFSGTRSNLLDDYTYNMNNSELSNIILGLGLLNTSYLILTFILLINLIFKLGIFNENNTNYLSYMLGNRLNTNLKYYIDKLIYLNKKTSSISIFIILFILLISLSFECYYITIIRQNLDLLVDLHIETK